MTLISYGKTPYNDSLQCSLFVIFCFMKRWSLNQTLMQILYHFCPDKDRYGYQMLEKMGWADGKGLGREKSGSTSHVKIKKRKQNLGMVMYTGVLL